jgi:hypothetical protein
MFPTTTWPRRHGELVFTEQNGMARRHFSDLHQAHPFEHNHFPHVAGFSSQSDADSYFARALLNRMRDLSVDSDRCKQQCRASEDAHQ